MRAIFIARGPAFSHVPNSRVAEFQNIEVYNIVCDSLGITPNPNNGTLRLPLKTQGLHSDVDAFPLETPQDPVEPSSDPVEPSSKPADADEPQRNPEQHEPDEPEDKEDATASKTFTSWWDFVYNKLQKAKEWAKELAEALEGNKAGKVEQEEDGKTSR